VTKTRDFGTLGLCQTWKQFRTFPGKFPIYEGDHAAGPIYEGLGPIRPSAAREQKG
jgi:hypothetical protein